MKIFRCPVCGTTAWLNNLTCGCGAELCFDPDAEEMVTGAAPCANRATIGCNWRAEGDLCRSCAMTEVVPDTWVEGNLDHWRAAEEAKRWVLAGLLRWGWFSSRDPGPRPRFHLVAEKTRHGGAEVVMGHAEGLVTINVTEADPVEQVRRQTELSEEYRTMIGHFRHEIAHFLFVRLLAAPGFAEAFRALFGDERADYGAALERHYRDGPPPDWAQHFITAYASAHPHEDWAETAAHLMHLTDIVDSAAAAGLKDLSDAASLEDPYAIEDAEALISRAVALGLALNHVNRSMGHDDLYPFVLGNEVRGKLGFVHGWIRCPAPVPAPA